MNLSETPFLGRYEFALSGGSAINYSDAPRMYAWLLARLPAPEAERFHEEGGLAVAQHIRRDNASGKSVWSVSLLSKEANSAILPVLEQEMTIELHPETLKATLLRQDIFKTPVEFIRHTKAHAAERVAEVSLLSPLAFHKGGRYAVYPEERLLLQSLINKWNASFSEYPMEDEDAMVMLENGIMIRDYQLRTVRFALKGNKIPGCMGKLYLQSRLPEPLFEIWNLLLWYGTFCGAGIKTTLGMGALDCRALRE